MLRRFRPLLTGFIIFSLILAACSSAPEAVEISCDFKNVIVLIPDGCNLSVQTLARLYKGAPLYLDKINSGAVRTSSASSIITDSAAAASALATGHKTSPQFLGVGPREEDLLKGYTPTASPYVPVASVLEGAKLQGMSTGVVATSAFTHATPAGYAAHIHSRNENDIIAKQMVYQNIDVLFAGGGRYLLPEGDTHETSTGGNWTGARKDSLNLLTTLQNRGYKIVDNRDDMISIRDGRVWGIFDAGHLSPEIDRTSLTPEQPSLAEMTEKAIEILSQNDNGFFLIVEGSQVDWAGHANDPVYMATDFIAFDDAVEKAVEFAKRDGNTLVIVVPDHDTGGMSLGNNSGFYYKNTYTMQVDDYMEIIRNATTTIAGLAQHIYRDEDVNVARVTDSFKEKWEMDLEINAAEEILALGNNPMALAEYINNNFTGLGWTTYGHTADDVPLWAYTDCVECLPRGNLDNTEIAHIIADGLKFDLNDATEKLFIYPGDVFPDYEVVMEAAGPVLKIGDFMLPAHKNLVKNGDEKFELKGIVVHAPMIDRFYIPEEAVRIINGN